MQRTRADVVGSRQILSRKPRQILRMRRQADDRRFPEKAAANVRGHVLLPHMHARDSDAHLPRRERDVEPVVDEKRHA